MTAPLTNPFARYQTNYVCNTEGCTRGDCENCKSHLNALSRLAHLRERDAALHGLLDAAGIPTTRQWAGAGRNHGDAFDGELPLETRVQMLCEKLTTEAAR